MKISKILKFAFILCLLVSLFVIGANAAPVDGIYGGGTVDADLLRLRSQPTTNSAIIGNAPDKSKVVLLEKTENSLGETWYKVNYNGAEGYMSADYINVEPISISLGSATVSGTSVSVRTGPDTSYNRVTLFNPGDNFNVVGINGQWYEIQSASVSGYIRSDYVILASDAEEPEDTPDVSGSAETPDNSDAAEQIPEPPVELSIGEKIIASAMQYLEVPYVYGGTSPYGFDCSGLVYYVYRENGLSITRRASTIYFDGTPISKDELRVGDPVFFSSDSSVEIEHVGLYIGNGQFIHASSGGGKVKINNLTDSYYLRNYYGAVQIF